MFLRILRNDLKRKKTMNIIVFLFVTMATMFLASSCSNLLTVNGALDYFMEISKVPDYFFVVLEEEGAHEIEDYLAESTLLSEYGKVQGISVLRENLYIIEEDGTLRDYEIGNSLTVQPSCDNFIKVFDANGEVLKLNEGEIALPNAEVEDRDLQVGDKLQLTIGEVTQELTLAVIMKDVTFGSKMIGFKRAVISDADYEKFQNQENMLYTNLYCVNSEDVKAFASDLQKQNFAMISQVEKGMLEMAYVMDMLIAVILIIVSVCLILISFLVLRFTIVFTLQEDFKEIGIMKAIGMRDAGIKGIYLVKYFAIAVLAASLGVVLSVPFGRILLEVTLINIVVEDTSNYFWLHIVSGGVIVSVVLWFCNMTANQLKRYSAIDAIRSGSNGERYTAKSRMKLWKNKKLKVGSFMALNDVLSHPKRFMVLILTFCVGTMLIQLPLSALHTLTSSATAQYFGFPVVDAYFNNNKAEQYIYDKDISVIEADFKEIEQKVAEYGYTAHAGTTLGYTISCYANDEEERYSFYTSQSMGSIEDNYVIVEGRMPQEEDEVMLTEVLAKKLDVTVGDYITYSMADGDKKYMVTGLYQSMINLGEGAYLCQKAKPSSEYLAGFFSMYMEIEELEAEEAVAFLREIYPDYRFGDIYEELTYMLGDITSIMEVVIHLITLIVLIMNSLITVLVMKAMMIRERGDIALLRSLGFTVKSIRGWLIRRVMIVLVIAVGMGTVLSKLLEPVTIIPIFAMQGAKDIEIVMNPLETFVLYPLMLLAATTLSAVWCTRDVRKVAPTEVNNIE
ncbi:MAG: FtsX-like permease family protein [Lachnospiraceae bacterium]|nr:FtsX-like permease family protein [Lachnospiraceae bacterium]